MKKGGKKEPPHKTQEEGEKPRKRERERESRPLNFP